MKFIEKNSSIIVATIVVAAILAGVFAVKNAFLPDESMAIYGTRLDGIKEVEITTNKKNKIEKQLREDASKIKVRISGRIINVYVKVNADTNLETAKSLGDKVLNELSSKEKKYYDVQILIDNDENASQFPIIGYKHHTKQNITWTKDRAES